VIRVEHDAIERVTLSLVGTIRDGLQGIGGGGGATQVLLRSPGADDLGDGVLLTVYLYDVVSHPHLRNANSDGRWLAGEETQPLVVELYYLLTAYATPDDTEEEMTQHRVLGRTLQVLHDSPVLHGLTGPDEDDEPVRVTRSDHSLSDITNLWSTFPDTPYHPSVSVVAGPVVIGSERGSDATGVRELEVAYDARRPAPEEARRE
jgi:hypothetical protein